MYLAHFGLFKKPFLISPDPEFLYPSPGHQEAFAHLRYGLQREGGFLVLTGEVGTGKTTLCRLLIEQLPEQFRLAYILNAQLDSLGLLRSICKELQIQTNEQSDDLNSYVEALYETLLKGYSNNQKTLIIIEEAQNLDPRVLETLRLLTNLETNTTKLLHILLIGQPELLDVLARPQLRQLNQRVVSRFHLSALSRKEVDLYVAHRLATACTRDGRSSAVFDNSALSAIYRHSKGIPRLINLLAEQALIAAYAENKSSVDGALVNRAAKEALGEVRRKSPSGWFWPAVAAVATVAGLLIAVSAHLLVETHNRSDKSAVASVVEDVQEPLPEVSFESPSQASSPEPIAPASAPIVPHSGGSPNEISTSMSAYEYPSVFAQWLQSAGIDGPALSPAEACGIAEKYQRVCERLENSSLAELHSLGVSALVSLFNQSEGKDFYFLTPKSSETASLSNSRGDIILHREELDSRWDFAATVIWTPPPGFTSPLMPGAQNESVVGFIESRLQAAGLLEPNFISGGIYSKYLVDQVKVFQGSRSLTVDGIAGMRTLMAFSTVDGSSDSPDSASLVGGE